MTAPAKSKPQVKVEPSILSLELHRILTDAQLFASRDATLPMIYAVQLEADGERLHARATDRFTLGISTTPYVGPKFKVLLPLPEVDLIRTFARPGRGWRKERRTTLHVTPQGTLLRINIDGMQLSVPTSKGEFPKYKQLFPENGAEVEAVPGGMGFNPAYLARFGRVSGNYGGARYYRIGANKPMVVTVGENFVGLIMPVRTPGDVQTKLVLPDWF